MNIPEHLFNGLPDEGSARRYSQRLFEASPRQAERLLKDEALLSDTLAIASYSPLLAETLLQNPDYFIWLKRERSDLKVRTKDEFVESLARFSLTNSSVEPQVLFARFRRRELIRIFLADIRKLKTVAEITDELSNLADAILENALARARQEMDNRFGPPFETGSNERLRPSEFCIVSLGKLGSRELNYSSDIDLMFLYSAEGETSGMGRRGKVTNREYFVKLAENIAALTGRQTGEGSAYRVDLRLRPHGRVGPLAMTVDDTVRYFRNEAAAWEKQVMIRSRSSGGDASLYTRFIRSVADVVYPADTSPTAALREVRLSKVRIDQHRRTSGGFDVKLGKGGIREIEFIAQALQLAYGGRDPWIRSGHTLISLARLAERGLITARQHVTLSAAYDLLRRLEHILQMEHGLQTHTVPDDDAKAGIIAERMGYPDAARFREDLAHHTAGVSDVFRKTFGEAGSEPPEYGPAGNQPPDIPGTYASAVGSGLPADDDTGLTSPMLSQIVTSFPEVTEHTPNAASDVDPRSFAAALHKAVSGAGSVADRLREFRREWLKHIYAIALLDTRRLISVTGSKRLQSSLADAAIDAALSFARKDVKKRSGGDTSADRIGILGLGKLGGGGIDYGSDLDLVIAYGDDMPDLGELSAPEYYARLVGSFVTSLSGYTREGSIYRIDLRLRPHGKNGPPAVSRSVLLRYLEETADIWELLAYLKVRSAGGDDGFAESLERDVSDAVMKHAARIPAAQLMSETARIRERLEGERSLARMSSDIDIKFGEGGMMDIYFAIRSLQLRDGIPDDPVDRSSRHMLDILSDRGSLAQKDHQALSAGYEYLSRLDHYLRLYAQRMTLLPRANRKLMELVADRMGAASPSDLIGELTMHRLAVRSAFENVVSC